MTEPGRVRGPRAVRSLVLFAAVVMSAAALAGCQTTGTSRAADPIQTGSVGSVSIKDAAAIGQRWEADKGNSELATAYAERLVALGQRERALEVLAEAAELRPDDPRILGAYGKQLAVIGDLDQASLVLARAVSTGRADWRVHSAQGSVLDRLGKHTEAREHYANALKTSSRPASVLNNLGMSYALEGDLARAEETLRQAVAQGGGDNDARLRQNLALVVALDGRFEEARQIAGKDLPPNLVDANMSYIKTIRNPA